MVRVYTARMREMNRLYRLRHLNEIRLKQKAYYLKVRTAKRLYDKKYYLENRKKLLHQRKKYYQENKPKVLKYLKEYQIVKTETDIQYRLARVIRSRMKHALKGTAKIGSCVRELGCTMEELVAHLERQFIPGMTWENYGLKGWHVDHVKPLASFDLSIKEEFLKACNYRNLRPMWAFDNLSKGAKMP